MKQFRLKEKATVIKTLKEPPKEKPGINWQRILFIGVLLLIVYSVGRKIYRGSLLIIGDGQVRLEKLSVQFTDDIRISSMRVQEGDTVKTGDTLFYFKYENAEDDVTSIVDSENPSDWLIREKLHTRKQISLKKAEVSRWKKQLQFKEKELEHQKELIILGVNEIESRLSYIQNDIIRLKSNHEVLRKEIYYLRKYLKDLEGQEIAMRRTEVRRKKQVSAILAYVSTLDGIIGQIHQSVNEVCYKQDYVMTIHQLDQLKIKAFFDPYDVPYIQKGDIVSISFPDGTQSEGFIQNFYISTYALPEEFQKKYEPIERNIVADVLPLNELETGNWLKFYKMQVEITKHRYKMPF